MIIKTWRDPYETGVSLTKPKQIELNPGLTVLVGCNGSGKTTLALNIKEEAKKEGIPCVFYDNLKDGGSFSLSGLLAGVSEYEGDDMSTAVSLWDASEGEAIKINVNRHSTLYKEFLKTGFFRDKSYKFARIFMDDDEKEIADKRRIFIYDATDSGMSIDSIVELKLLFKNILDLSAELGLETYVLITANEYELCRNEDCFDVVKGKYLHFDDYEDYRKFILTSRSDKEKRIDKQIAWRVKQAEKEKVQYEQKVAEIKAKIAKMQQKSELTYRERWQIEDLERELSRIKNHLRFYNPSKNLKSEEEQIEE